MGFGHDLKHIVMVLEGKIRHYKLVCGDSIFYIVLGTV